MKPESYIPSERLKHMGPRKTEEPSDPIDRQCLLAVLACVLGYYAAAVFMFGASRATLLAASSSVIGLSWLLKWAIARWMR